MLDIPLNKIVTVIEDEVAVDSDPHQLLMLSMIPAGSIVFGSTGPNLNYYMAL